jgi:2-dehydro-3-deoxygalactonokinase
MTANLPAAQFLSCDWGTSTFRLRLVEVQSGQSLASVITADGINGVHQAWRAVTGANREEWFFDVVRRQLAKLAAESGRSVRDLPLVISGMATASIGLREIPHKEMPFAIDGSDLRVERLVPPPAELGPVLLVSGARSADDVMRGEEVQVVGAVALGAERDALFILPGTHSKHVRVEQERAVGLRTYMTGEFFDLLARRSILANSIETSAAGESAEWEDAFSEGVATGKTENLLHASFGVRVTELNGRRGKQAGFHYLSGLVIGTELRELQALGTKAIVLVGNPALTARYALALRVIDHTGPITEFSADQSVVAGQLLVARRAGLLA